MLEVEIKENLTEFAKENIRDKEEHGKKPIFILTEMTGIFATPMRLSEFGTISAHHQTTKSTPDPKHL